MQTIRNLKPQSVVRGLFIIYLFPSFLTRTAQKPGLWCTKKAVDFLAAILLIGGGKERLHSSLVSCSVMRGDRPRWCFGCSPGDLFVCLFVLPLAHNTEILGRTRAIENNLLLGIQVSPCHQLWVPHCVALEAIILSVGCAHHSAI